MTFAQLLILLHDTYDAQPKGDKPEDIDFRLSDGTPCDVEVTYTPEQYDGWEVVTPPAITFIIKPNERQ